MSENLPGPVAQVAAQVAAIPWWKKVLAALGAIFGIAAAIAAGVLGLIFMAKRSQSEPVPEDSRSTQLSDALAAEQHTRAQAEHDRDTLVTTLKTQELEGTIQANATAAKEASHAQQQKDQDRLRSPDGAHDLLQDLVREDRGTKG